MFPYLINPKSDLINVAAMLQIQPIVEDENKDCRASSHMYEVQVKLGFSSVVVCVII